MSFERKINELYNQIAQKINDMIPTDWEHFALCARHGDHLGGESPLWRYTSTNH